MELSAADYDSGMLYYDYSYDGGETFSPLFAWGDQSKDTIEFTMQAPPHIIPQIVVRGYNGCGLFTESNLVSLPSMDFKTQEEIAAELEERERLESAAEAEAEREAMSLPRETEKEAGTNADTERAPAEEEKEPSIRYFLSVCLVCALLVIGMALSMAMILNSQKRRRRRRRRRINRAKKDEAADK